MSNFRQCVFAAILGSTLILSSVGEANAQRRKSAFGNDKGNTPTQPNATPVTPGSPLGQPGNMSPTPNRQPVRTPDGKKKSDEFAPQVVNLEVKGEGVQLVATWFPPIVEDKKKSRKKKAADPNAENEPEAWEVTAPFILVHDWTRNRNDLLSMASFLQSKGHAVIVPDLRGHGQSLAMRGSTKPLDYKKFKKSEKASAIGDIDQCKRFLQEKNNEKILNMDLLNVIAVGDSCHLAIAWSMSDWSWEPVAGIKQGKDVKSLVLFAPSKKFAGSSLNKLVKEPLLSGRGTTPLPMLVVWGGRSEGAEDCDDFVKMLRKFRPEAPKEDDMATRWFKQNLFHFEAPSPMEGFELAGDPRAQRIWNFANDFISQKVLVHKEQCPWQIRGAEAVLKAREAQN